MQIYTRHVSWLHKQQQFILRYLKIVHHSCEYTRRCKTSELMFVSCTAKIWIAFSYVEIVCMSTILRRFDTTTKTHTTNVSARPTYAKARLKLIKFRSQSMCIAPAPIVKGAQRTFFIIEHINTISQFWYRPRGKKPTLEA